MNDPHGNQLVDLIDGHGRITGTVTRKQMRVDRLPYRGIFILLFNTEGKLFIHLRTATKDINPGFWDVTIAGVVAAGESFDCGASRELQEELGIDAKPRPLFTIHYEDSMTSVHGVAYRLIHDGPFVLQAEEIVRGEFLALEEVASRRVREPFCGDGLAVLAEYLHRIRETNP
jgi:isopentenyldiphosphate isomerase